MLNNPLSLWERVRVRAGVVDLQYPNPIYFYNLTLSSLLGDCQPFRTSQDLRS
jgi:hypothetical protein